MHYLLHPVCTVYIMSEMLQQEASLLEFIIGEHLRKEDCRIICKEISFIQQIPTGFAWFWKRSDASQGRGSYDYQLEKWHTESRDNDLVFFERVT